MITSRLVHTPEGFLRYMQMSKETLFVFVEGKQQDPFILGLICSSVCNSKNVPYQICKASELPGQPGGKAALLSFHDYLRRRKAFKTILSSKYTNVAFFMDKDIDDILRRQRRSQHVIYTRYYDIINDIFRNGRLLQAVAASASIDPTMLTPLLADAQAWCRQAAERWKDWVVLCMVAACECINQQCNYRVSSKVQCKNTGKPDPTLIAKMKADMQIKSGIDASKFDRTYRSIALRVHRIYKVGNHDRIFKGKWYPILLDEDVFRQWGHTGYDRTGFISRITSTLAVTLRAEDSWAQEYRLRLEQILDN